MGLFFGLAPPVIGFLAGEGDWVSPERISPERMGIRDWLLVSGTAAAVGLCSVKQGF